MVHLEFRENIKMLTVATNDIFDQKYFIHLIRTSLTKSGKNFGPIRNIQYFGIKTDPELYMVRLEFRENIKMLTVPTNDISAEKYFIHLII